MGIVLAATPLGNPADASMRLRELLASADVIAAEDTRRIHRLAKDLDVVMTGRVMSYFEANERDRTPELIAAAKAGSAVLIVTDAGMPTVSDPGFRIAAAAAAERVPITVAPGPSAVLAALALSGLPTDRFCFEGFLPRKTGERRTRLTELRDEPRTMVFFEAPHRLTATLTAMQETFGMDRTASVSRELTKTYEETIRGTLAEILEWSTGGVRGEITIVVAGASLDETRRLHGLTDPVDWVARVGELVDQGVDRREAIADVARAARVPKREVYDAVIAAKSSQ